MLSFDGSSRTVLTTPGVNSTTGVLVGCGAVAVAVHSAHTQSAFQVGPIYLIILLYWAADITLIIGAGCAAAALFQLRSRENLDGLV